VGANQASNFVHLLIIISFGCSVGKLVIEDLIKMYLMSKSIVTSWVN